MCRDVLLWSEVRLSVPFCSEIEFTKIREGSDRIKGFRKVSQFRIYKDVVFKYAFKIKFKFQGIEVNTFYGLWKIEEWDADMSVTYYWSGERRHFYKTYFDMTCLDPWKWESSAGKGISVPVSAVLEGMATINGMRDILKITIDYSDFFEVCDTNYSCVSIST